MEFACGFYQLNASCGFYWLGASLSSSCVVPDSLSKLKQLALSKLVGKKSRESTCIQPVDNLHQTCYHQVGEVLILQDKKPVASFARDQYKL